MRTRISSDWDCRGKLYTLTLPTELAARELGQCPAAESEIPLGVWQQTSPNKPSIRTLTAKSVT